MIFKDKSDEFLREVHRLLICFPQSFVNHSGEFIAVKRTNLYFNLKDCNCLKDLQRKAITWFSRDAFKTQPFTKQSANDKYNQFVSDCMNEFLNTNFVEDDWEIIYSLLGNDVNPKLCEKFISHNFDIKVLINYEKRKISEGLWEKNKY